MAWFATMSLILGRSGAWLGATVAIAILVQSLLTVRAVRRRTPTPLSTLKSGALVVGMVGLLLLVSTFRSHHFEGYLFLLSVALMVHAASVILFRPISAQRRR